MENRLEEGLLYEAAVIRADRISMVGCACVGLVFLGFIGGFLYIAHQFSEKVWV
jgi:hypothetical protein